MFLQFIDGNGAEKFLADAAGLERAIRSGEVTGQTMVKSAPLEEWTPAHEHAAFIHVADRIASADSAAKAETASFAALLIETTPRVFVTYTLLGLNVLYFGLLAIFGVSVLDPTSEQLVYFGANFGPLTLNGQWLRLFVSTFIHIGLVHLLLNAWCLWNVGRLAERIYGNGTFALIYALSGLGASLASVWWQPAVVSAGASGAIFGIAGALVAFFYFETKRIPRSVIHETRNSLLAFVGYNLSYGFTHSGIDNAAHVGGLLAGLTLGALLHRPLGPSRARVRPRDVITYASVAALLVGGAQLARMQGEDDPLVIAVAGEMLQSDGDLEGAVAKFRRALELDPDMGSAHYNLGSIYLKKKLYDKAVLHARRAVELGPKDARNQMLLANALDQTGDAAGAVAALEKAVALQPDDEITLNNAAWLYATAVSEEARNPQKALGYAQKAVQLTSETEPSYLDTLAEAYYRLGNFDSALQAEKKAISLAPDNDYYKKQLIRFERTQAQAGQ